MNAIMPQYWTTLFSRRGLMIQDSQKIPLITVEAACPRDQSKYGSGRAAEFLRRTL